MRSSQFFFGFKMSQRFLATYFFDGVWIFYDKKTTAKYYVDEKSGCVFLEMDTKGAPRGRLNFRINFEAEARPSEFFLTSVTSDRKITNKCLSEFAEEFKKHLEYE